MMAPGMGMRSVPKRQRGVALAIVVWFIAGMSLLVAGIVGHARVDTKLTQLHLARAKTVAAGDGATLLAMSERIRGFQSAGVGPLVSETAYRLGDADVRVRIIPASGFIDLNRAPVTVLAALFAIAGGLEPGEAKYLADNVVKWRRSDTGSRRNRRKFYATEDLLRVEGMNRTVLDGIRDYAIAADWASGAMNWTAAPKEMLDMLEAVNPGQVDNIQQRRSTLMRSGGGSQRGVLLGAGGVYRADALVDYGGRIWLRRSWLSVGGSQNRGLPWRVVRTEPPRVVAG